MLISSCRKLTLAFLLALSLTACDKISQENYEKIQTDMSVDEVSKILGEPTETSSVELGSMSGTSSSWKSEKKGEITIKFVNGKVKSKNYNK